MILIDAETLLLDRPEYRNPIHEKNGEYNRGWNDCVDMFYDIIKGQSTAYDVDKVVEELKNKQDHHKELADYERQVGTIVEMKEHECAIRVLSEAIDIVKRGGVTC